MNLSAVKNDQTTLRNTRLIFFFFNIPCGGRVSRAHDVNVVLWNEKNDTFLHVTA